MRKFLAAMCLPALAAIVLAGCGSSKKSTTASTSTSPSAGVNAAIAAHVPAAVNPRFESLPFPQLNNEWIATRECVLKSPT